MTDRTSEEVARDAVAWINAFNSVVERQCDKNNSDFIHKVDITTGLMILAVIVDCRSEQCSLDYFVFALCRQVWSGTGCG